MLLSTFSSIHCLTKSAWFYFKKVLFAELTRALWWRYRNIILRGFRGYCVCRFSKAFDKVPHKCLGCKLASHGIDGNVRKWIAKWLCWREQRVVINDAGYKLVRVPSGVPQLSVLESVLFLIYTNGIDYAVDTILKKFADDTKLYERVRMSRRTGAFNADFSW